MTSQRTTLTARDTAQMHLIDSEGNRGAVAVEMGYDPADPFAMSFTFMTSTPVTWTFARDLIATGIYEPTGEGDVHVWPCLSTNGCAVVIVELSSNDGSIMIECGLREIAAFVRRMHTMVAPGTEADHLNLDQELARLFA